jgi:hypothetical protein
MSPSEFPDNGKQESKWQVHPDSRFSTLAAKANRRMSLTIMSHRLFTPALRPNRKLSFMHLSTIALDRLEIVKAMPNRVAITANDDTLIFHGGRWLLTGRLDDVYISGLEALKFAASGKIVERKQFGRR